MTGIRARTLRASLLAAGYELTDKNDDDTAITDDLPHEVRQGLVRLYQHLGGVLDLRDFAVGEWDFNLAGGFKIELDEYMHFNRYRAESCIGPWAQDVPWLGPYRDYSEQYEYKCFQIRLPGAWANKSSDYMFGGSDPLGVIGELGPSRWKQRALYDAVKDAYACHQNVSLARISVIDTINGISVQRELKKGRLLDPTGLRTLLEARTVSKPAAKSLSSPSSV
jgi:hypothetical protein